MQNFIKNSFIFLGLLLQWEGLKAIEPPTYEVNVGAALPLSQLEIDFRPFKFLSFGLYDDLVSHRFEKMEFGKPGVWRWVNLVTSLSPHSGQIQIYVLDQDSWLDHFPEGDKKQVMIGMGRKKGSSPEEPRIVAVFVRAFSQGEGAPIYLRLGALQYVYYSLAAGEATVKSLEEKNRLEEVTSPSGVTPHEQVLCAIILRDLDRQSEQMRSLELGIHLKRRLNH